MPKTLTDLDQFDSSIDVPLGSDSRNAAAQAVESIAQRLANRTHYLDLRSGKLANNQTWAGANTFNGIILSLAQALLKTAAVDVAAVTTSRPLPGGDTEPYQLHWVLETGSGDNVRVYSGRYGDTIGSFLIVYNARWVPSGASMGWTQENTGKASSAVIMRYQDIRFVGKPVGTTTPWTSWQQNAGSVDVFGSTILGEVFRAGRFLTQANNNTDSSNGYRYDNALQRNGSPIPLGMLWGNTMLSVEGHVQRRLPMPSADNDQIWIPIPVPPYCGFGQVHVNFYQLQPTVADWFHLFRRQTNGPWVLFGSSTPEYSATFGGQTTLDLHTSGVQYVRDDEEYAYRWKVVSTDSLANNNRIVGVSVDWMDIGPSNRIG